MANKDLKPLDKQTTEEYIFKELTALSEKVNSTSGMPEDLRERLDQMLDRLNRMAKLGHYAAEYDTLSRYIEVITQVPWDKRTIDKLDLEATKKILDKNHFGMQDVKDRILEYMSTMILIKQRG